MRRLRRRASFSKQNELPSCGHDQRVYLMIMNGIGCDQLMPINRYIHLRINNRLVAHVISLLLKTNADITRRCWESFPDYVSPDSQEIVVKTVSIIPITIPYRIKHHFHSAYILSLSIKDEKKKKEASMLAERSIHFNTMLSCSYLMHGHSTKYC